MVPKRPKIQMWLVGKEGEFVPIVPVAAEPRRKIVCLPVPGRDGVEYVPEWWGLTIHG